MADAMTMDLFPYIASAHGPAPGSNLPGRKPANGPTS